MVHSLDKRELKFDVTEPDTKPKKFIMWLFVVSSTIMFGGWTSFYIVFAASKGKGHGLLLPDAFMYSTGILLASSVCLFLASRSSKMGEISIARAFMFATLALGLAFGYMQFDAWSVMVNTGAVLMNNNAAISLIYIVSGFHLLHIVAGLCIILNAIFGTYKDMSVEKRKYRMEIASIFWHFIDILWIYLYVFLLLNS